MYSNQWGFECILGILEKYPNIVSALVEQCVLTAAAWADTNIFSKSQRLCTMAVKINKVLLPVKAHYFFKFAGLAMTSFLPVIVRQKGIPTEGVGMMWSFLPVVNITSIILISYIADRFKAHRRFFLAALFIMLLGLAAICFTPSISQMDTCNLSEVYPSYDNHENFNKLTNNSVNERTQNLTQLISNLSSVCDYKSVFIFECTTDDIIRDLCLKNTTMIPLDKSIINCNFYVNGKEIIRNKTSINLSKISEPYALKCNFDTCSIISSNNISYSLSENIKCQDNFTFSFGTNLSGEESLQLTEVENNVTMTDTVLHIEFWLILISLVIMYSGNHVSMNLVDTATLQILGTDSHKFGYQRLYGTLGWGLMALAYGTIIDYFSKGLPQRDYTSGFVLALVMFALTIISGALIKFHIEKKDEKNEGTMGNTLKQFQVILFLTCILEVGASQGCIMTFFFMLMEDVALAWNPHFQDLNLLQGLTLTIGCFCGEIPSMFMSGYIIKKLGSFLSFVIVLIVYSIRFILHSFVSNPWYFLPIEVLHGISYGLLYPNMSAYASKVAPPGRKATMQGIVKSVYAAGTSLGALVGGVIFKLLGGSQLFFLLGCLNFGFLAIFVLAQLILNRSHQTKDTKEEVEEAFLANQTNDVQLNGVIVPTQNKET